MSKPRNPLLQMPEGDQARLADWLLGGMTYHEANLLLEKEFSIAPGSLSRFTPFWSEVCVPQLLLRRRRMAGTAAERAKEATANPAEFDRATLDALQQKAYELAENPQADPKDVKAILTLLLKAKDQSLEERRLELDLSKFKIEEDAFFQRLLKSAAEINASNLSNAEKIAAMRQAAFADVDELQRSGKIQLPT